MISRNIAYWIATIWVAGVMAVTGTLAVTHAPGMMRGLSRFGYPVYFANLLGYAKLAGVCVFLSPGLVRLKEWSYVGFGITIISAMYSHFSSGDGWMALDPLVTFAALAVSYRTRPANRLYFTPAPRSLDGDLPRGDIARTAKP